MQTLPTVKQKADAPENKTLSLAVPSIEGQLQHSANSKVRILGHTINQEIPQLLAYHPRPGHVGFCVDNVKLRRNSTGILVFIAISIAPRYYTHPFIYFRRYTECPTRYRIRHFFNNFTTNEDIAMKFEADLPQCVRNVTTTNVILFKFCCNIFISV